MVITDVNQVTYNGDGTTTAFPFTFKIIDASNIKLILIAENGLQTEITSDYYVDVENNTVYYPGYAPGSEPPEADQPAKVQVGEKLEIYRWIPINQLADLGEKWPFAVIEAGLDKLTMLLQDIYGWVGRNLINKVTGGTAWDADNLPISNVGGPFSVADAATKDYVDKVLSGIIASGDGRIIPYDTVAQMCEGDLVAGQIAFTLGYHDINDGGAGVYNIRTATLSDVDDGGSIIILDNGSVAELIEKNSVNVKQFGAYGDETHDDSSAIQAAINYVKAGTVVIPESTYLVDNDIKVYNKGADNLQKRFKLDATGAKFVGTGKLIIDSSRRINVSGLQMSNQDLCLRGCWWSDFENMQVRSIQFGDASGTSYSSEYWVNFKDLILQCAEVGSAGNANEITYYSCAFIGSATHGFSQAVDYAFNLHKSIQSWKLVGGDVSYHTYAVYHADSDDIGFDIYFYGVYFDTFLPQMPTSNKQFIVTDACKNAEGTGSRNPMATVFQNAIRGRVGLWSATRNYQYNGMTLFNLIPGGDMQNDLGTWTGDGKPIYSANSATITRKAGGLYGNYLNINQTLTSSNAVNFKTMNFPLSGGMLCGVMLLRNADAGTKTVRISHAGVYHNVSVSNDSWTLFTACAPATGTYVNVTLSTNDGTAYNVDVAYVGVTYGNSPAVFAPSMPFKTINKEVAEWVTGSIAAGASYTEAISVAGASVGDYVDVSLAAYQAAQTDIMLYGVVSASGTVTVVARNLSATAQEITSATLCIKVTKRLLG